MYQLCINVLVLFNQLYQSIQSSLRSGQGHSGDVVAAACFQLADGAWRVVSGSSDETLRVWDPVAGGEALVDTVCMEGSVRALDVAVRFHRPVDAPGSFAATHCIAWRSDGRLTMLSAA